MKFTAVFLVVFSAFLVVGQSAFDRSHKAFEQYLSSDSTRAKKELTFQRLHAGSRTQKQRYLLNLAAFYLQISNLERLESTLEKVEAFSFGKEVELEGEFVRLKSLLYFRKNNYDASTKLIRSFFKRRTTIPDETRVALELNICENEMAKGAYSKARYSALNEYKMIQKHPDALSNKMKVRLFSSLYNSCYYEAKYDSALYYLYKAEPFLKEASVEKAGFYSRLAIVHTILHEHPKAIRLYKKSIAIYEKSNEPVQLAHTWYNLGVSYKEVNIDKAIACMERSLQLARNAKADQVIGYSLQDLGDIYLTRKQYAKAEKYNLEALEVLRAAGNDRGVATVLLNLGRQGLETNRFEEALTFLKEALKMTENSEDLAGLEYCYEYLYKTYEQMGDFRLAHRYHKLYAKTQQKLLKLDMRSNIEQLNLSYDVRVKEATNKILREEVELKNKKIAAERNVRWLLAGLLVAAFGAIFFIRRTLIQRAKLKELQLQLVQSELSVSEREKLHTMEELETVKQQLISKNTLIGELNKLVVENEQTLISKEQLSNLATNDADWVHFLAKLQILFPNYSDNLKSKHPNLSNNEFRLAALIRLNLSDKEISELLFIEISSVKKAKHRLKQKLSLEVGDKLDVYLGQL